MDYPKSVPNVGLVEGKFVDENPTTGQVGSLIPSAWGNSVTEELLSVIKAAGLTPDESQVNQLLKAIQTFAAADMKKTVRVATTGAIALSGLQSIDGVALAAGDRVLVKNQANAAQNGLYSAGGGVWVRTQDADENIEVSPGMMVPVQAGTVNYGSIWQLSNITPPNVGATALNFEQVLGNTGIAPGTYKSLTVDRRGRAVAGSNPTTVDGMGITDALKVGIVSQQLPVLAAAMPASSNTEQGWALRIREAQGVGAAQRDQAYAPRIAFHWGNTNIGDLAMTYSADLMWKGQRIWHEGNFDPSAKANSLDVTNALALKANKGTTLASYNIGDTLTTVQINAAIRAAIDGLVSGAPGALDTLQELAAALGGDANFATTVLNKLAQKADIATSLRVGSVSKQVPVLSAPEPGGTDGSGNGGALQIREAKEATTSQTHFDWAPRILFHWQGFLAKDLAMSRDGDLMWDGQKVGVGGSFNAQTNGHIVLPKSMGGFILQWCEGPVAGIESAVYPPFAFPLSFPSACLFCGAFTRSTTDTAVSDQIFQVSGFDRLNVKLFPQWFGTGTQGLVRPLIFAIGI